jgi:membrane-associated phospholipid phosphatase
MMQVRVVSYCCVVSLLLGGADASLAQGLPDAASPAEVQPAADHANRFSATSQGRKSPGLKAVFAPLGQDIRNLATEKNILILTTGLLASANAQRWDSQAADARWANRALSSTLAPGRHVGSMVAQSSVALATYVAGRAFDQPRVATLGAELVRAQIIAQAATQAVKFSIRRTRPDGTALSFPSGHTSSSFATATVLHSNFGWKVGAPAFTVATLIATSRVKDQRHYLSDVITGAAVGILAGRAVTVGRGAARFALSPMAAPGGVGISVVKIAGR